MRRLLKVLRWIAEHVVVRMVNLNDDKEAKPHSAVVVGVTGKF